MKGVLIRTVSNEVQTLGYLDLYNGSSHIFHCCTLELPDLNNTPQKSRIPEGVYEVEFRPPSNLNTYKKESFLIKDVPGRSGVLIHAGNYYTQIRGCILIGSKFLDINIDNHVDVINSGNTLTKLIELAVLGFELRIIDNDK